MSAKNPMLWGRFARPTSGWQKRPSVGDSKGYYGHRWQMLRQDVFRDQGNVCRLCGRTPAGEVDHIVPIARGGAMYDKANLQVLCPRCHRRKTAQEGGRKSGSARTSQPGSDRTDFR